MSPISLTPENVAIIDTATNTVAKTVLVGTPSIGALIGSGVAVAPDGVHVYVANQGSNSVSVINTAGNKVVATIPISGPSAIFIIPPPNGVGGPRL